MAYKTAKRVTLVYTANIGESRHCQVQHKRGSPAEPHINVFSEERLLSQAKGSWHYKCVVNKWILECSQRLISLSRI